MHKYNLGFISDIDIFNHVSRTVLKYRFKINLKTFNKNIIDPIKLTFDSKIYNKTIRDTVENEILRQIDKTNQNEIGYFHQYLFKYIDPSWTVPQNGYDIINTEKHYYVEMKNKHNTMNSSSSQKTFMRMLKTIHDDDQACCLLVEVIAKESQNKAWRISLDGTPISDERIRKVSIDKFYEIVTGKKNAFKDLCEKLPLIIEDVVSSIKTREGSNTVFNELEMISPNLLKSLYLLSFQNYEGFDEFNI